MMPGKTAPERGATGGAATGGAAGPGTGVGGRLGLTKEGARAFRRGVAACALANVALMLPVGLVYLVVRSFVGRLEDPAAPLPHPLACTAAVAAVLAAMVATQWLEYRFTYLGVYGESARKRIGLADRLSRLPLSFFGSRDLADLTGLVMKDCSDQERMFMHVMPHLFGTGLSTALVVAVSFVFDWRLALAAFWSLPAAFLVMALTARVQRGRAARMEAERLRLSGDVQEFLDLARELRVNDRTEGYLARLDARLDEFERAQRRSELLTGACVTSAQAVLKLGVATTVLAGAVLIAEGGVDFLTYFVFLLVATRAYDPVALVLESIGELLALRLSVRRTVRLFEEPVMEGSREFSPRGYDLTFDDVSFSYGAAGGGAAGRGAAGDCPGRPVLSHVSFTARQGSVTALVGPSGSGKSTCARLAARFWDPDAGRVLLGGVDLAAVDPEALLACYSEVFQDVVLFDESVMDNIRLGRRGATDEEVLEAARAAMCDEFVRRLPQGYETRVGENGARLSGGERQRISIARALLKDAPVVLLDEATASLDVESESQVQRALSRLLVGKTVLVVAHRMRTVLGADHVVVLRDGEVAEQGSPQDLLARDGGLFRRMSELQHAAAGWRVGGSRGVGANDGPPPDASPDRPSGHPSDRPSEVPSDSPSEVPYGSRSASLV